MLPVDLVDGGLGTGHRLDQPAHTAEHGVEICEQPVTDSALIPASFQGIKLLFQVTGQVLQRASLYAPANRSLSLFAPRTQPLTWSSLSETRIQRLGETLPRETQVCRSP